MKEKIVDNLEKPAKLEQLYRSNPSGFKAAFTDLYPEIEHHPSSQFWFERLNYVGSGFFPELKKEWFILLLLAFVSGLIAKIPGFLSIDPDAFFPRNISFVVFPALMVFFLWKQANHWRNYLTMVIIIGFSVLYINILPNNNSSNTLILASIHLPLVLWAWLGVVYAGKNWLQPYKRLEFLRFNGDLIVMTTVLLIAGGILSAITVNLFNLIEIKIDDIYFDYVAIWGLAAAPVVGTYLVFTNPSLVQNVSPVIARVFTPLVLVMLVIYLVSLMLTGRSPYNDREFLLIFNILLIGVMALILFSIAESKMNSQNRGSILLLLSLSVVTIAVCGIALSAIIYRLFAFGITPNRLAVLGSNLLMFTNLILVAFRLLQSLKTPSKTIGVQNSIAAFLPYYAIWTILVCFLFPLLFQFQ